MSGEEKTCEFGCVYSANKESEHQDSNTCSYLYLKCLERRKFQNDFIDHHQKRTINVLISNAKQSIQGERECGKCDFSGNIQEVIRHEKECIGFKNEIDFNEEKKLYSDKKVTCKYCGKVFLHTCSTSEPKHQLNRHAKICQKSYNRKLKQEIKKSLNDLDNTPILQKILELMNN
jgi:hypothetical protein